MFWQHLLGLLRPRWTLRPAPHVVFEYRFSADGMQIAVWVPATVPAAQIAAAARSAWPGTRTTITLTPPPQPRQVGVAGGRLRLARPAALPLRSEHRLDPLRALIGAATPLTPTEGVRVQVLARPISAARLATLVRNPRTADLGARILGGAAAVMAALAQEMVSTAVHGPTHTSRSHRRASVGERGPARLVASAQDRAAASKAHGAGGGHTVAVRYLCTVTPTGPGRDAARTARARAARRARAVGAAFAQHSGHNHLRRRPLHRPQHAIERRRLRRGDPMSVPEVAALAHLPTDDHVSGLQRAGAAAVAPPPQVPVGGVGVRLLGDSDAVPERPVGLSVADARHHLWVLGATGAGKSTLLVHQVLADAAAGRAAIVIDPKGDLVDDITARLPDHTRDRLVLLDPDQPGQDGRWPCLNPLDPLGLRFPRDRGGFLCRVSGEGGVLVVDR
ncbi:helicase HerA domain-containing protein [Pseudonocardia sp. HH130629-09]|uniref:helicase HerA domain-containing protein n=1 Tax=Pseudonocardia sp. HH130629-09 TaxID=1641402 RepID=UPI0011AE3BA1|nr:type IV secretory system conjugative DNA transfer family protein [Pseudonocardia sp. HH130629-09]